MVNWTLDGSANNASGSLNGSSLVGSQFSLDMQVDPNSSTASPVVGDWTFSIVSGGTTQGNYRGTGRRSAMTFTNVTTVDGQPTRRYTMVLGAITGITGAAPAVSQLQLTFLASPNGSGGFLKFGQSLTFAANQTAGSLSMVANSPFGMLSTPGFTAVPSPGAVALLGAAGFFVSCRRGQAA